MRIDCDLLAVPPRSSVTWSVTLMVATVGNATVTTLPFLVATFEPKSQL